MSYESENSALLRPLRNFERDVLQEAENVRHAEEDVNEHSQSVLESGRKLLRSLEEPIGAWNIYLTESETKYRKEVDRYYEPLKDKIASVLAQLDDLLRENGEEDEGGTTPPHQKWIAKAREHLAEWARNFDVIVERERERLEKRGPRPDEAAHATHTRDDNRGFAPFKRWLKGFFQHPHVASPNPHSSDGG